MNFVLYVGGNGMLKVRELVERGEAKGMGVEVPEGKVAYRMKGGDINCRVPVALLNEEEAKAAQERLDNLDSYEANDEKVKAAKDALDAAVAAYEAARGAYDAVVNERRGEIVAKAFEGLPFAGDAAEAIKKMYAPESEEAGTEAQAE